MRKNYKKFVYDILSHKMPEIMTDLKNNFKYLSVPIERVTSDFCLQQIVFYENCLTLNA